LKVDEVKTETDPQKEARKRSTMIKDGRPWKKDSGTQWSGFGNVTYSDYSGSYTCTNPRCESKKEYGVVNATQFNKMK